MRKLESDGERSPKPEAEPSVLGETGSDDGVKIRPQMFQMDF